MAEDQPFKSSTPNALQKTRKKSTSPAENMTMTVQQFLFQHPPSSNDLAPFLSTLPKRWSFYPPLILLPQSSFSSINWKEYLDSLPEDIRNLLFSQITSMLKGTH